MEIKTGNKLSCQENSPKNKDSKENKQGFFKRNKQKIIKLAVVALIVAIFSIGCYLLFDKLGFLDEETDAFDGYGSLIYIIFIGLFVLQAICLCMIPGNTTIFITLAMVIFGDNPAMALLVVIVGVWLGGIALFFVGRFGGRRVLYWLFGKEEVDKKLCWVTQKGATALPAFFVVPFMPNDMICMVCGMSRLKFWQFLMIIIPFRVIEVLMIVSYPIIIDFFVSGRSLQDIIIFVNIIIVDLVLIAMYYKLLVRVFRKTILRKKYVSVPKVYTVLEEVPD